MMQATRPDWMADEAAIEVVAFTNEAAKLAVQIMRTSRDSAVVALAERITGKAIKARAELVRLRGGMA
jgi:hypothetical protein